jgi:hypothetical protein
MDTKSLGKFLCTVASRPKEKEKYKFKDVILTFLTSSTQKSLDIGPDSDI